MSWFFPASITQTDAAEHLAQGLVALSHGEDVFDAQELKHFDSSVLALMLGWRRAERSLVFHNLPKKLSSLARIYGVDKLLA